MGRILILAAFALALAFGTAVTPGPDSYHDMGVTAEPAPGSYHDM